ncbi:hypothetical protein EU527_19415, partial [Candidatus Thorarchaeota archaeon]
DAVDAIKSYVSAGHGFVIDGGVMYYYPEEWDEFFGLTNLAPFEGLNSYIEIDQQYAHHPIFAGVEDPYVSGFPIAIYPSSGGWDSSNLFGATYIGLEDSVSPRGAIVTYRGMVFFSTLPEYMSNHEDCQILYNSLIWSEYVIPEHELSISLDVPDRIDPGTTTTIDITVYNSGSSTETDIDVILYVDSSQIETYEIPSLSVGASITLEYEWTVNHEGIYNVTVVVEAVPGENDTINNKVTKFVTARLLIDYVMIENEFTWFDAKANGVNLLISGDDVCSSIDLPFTFPYYDSLYSAVHISSNGWLSFSNPIPYDWSNVEFPSSDLRYVYAVAPMWADLYAENNIYYWGTENHAVIEYNDYDYLAGSLVGTYQVVFFEDGHIEFNYLSMGNIYRGTVGLNYGDGYHYNSFSSTSLSYITNFSLAFYYIVPEHDLSVRITMPDYGDKDEPVYLYPAVHNGGNSTETNVELIMYIDGDEVLHVSTPSLNPGEDFEFPFIWTPSNTGLHQISVYVPPVTGESITGNNLIARYINIQEPRNFHITSPTAGQEIEGGLVMVEYESEFMDDIMFIEVYINNEYIALAFDYQSGKIMVPVFSNGTNTIRFDVYWYSSNMCTKSVQIESYNVVPLFRPQPGDYFDWIELWGYMSCEMNYTFGAMVSEFEIEGEFIQHIRDENNITIDMYMTDFTVNLLNGYISGGMEGLHLFFVSGLRSPSATGSSAETGDPLVHHSWDDITYVTSHTIWQGYAVWRSYSPYTNSRSYTFRSNGILATHEYYGGAQYGWVVDTSFYPATDCNPPEYIIPPEDIYVELGTSLDHQFYIFDETGLNSFTVNDTEKFSLTLSGHLTNKVQLEIGIYGIEVIATDPYGYATSAELSIIVQDTTAPTWLISQNSITLFAGQNLEILLDAEDYSGIAYWSVNNTSFAVNSTGWLKNVASLSIGAYILEVTVFDPYDNENTMTIEINVIASTTPNEGELFLIYISLVFTSITVTGFIVILLIRKRMSASGG